MRELGDPSSILGRCLNAFRCLNDASVRSQNEEMELEGEFFRFADRGKTREQQGERRPGDKAPADG